MSEPESPPYKDDDFVYVDIDAKKVVGLVQWKEDGTPVPLEKPAPPPDPKFDRKGKKPKKRYYPWGTYLAMKKMYRLEGKKESTDSPPIELESAITKLQEEPFWNA